jgi:hypothetical protein
MMAETAALNNWRSRHPFPVGSEVICIDNEHAATLVVGKTYRVNMRGEDSSGPWIAVDDVLPRLPISFFCATDPNCITGVA